MSIIELAVVLIESGVSHSAVPAWLGGLRCGKATEGNPSDVITVVRTDNSISVRSQLHLDTDKYRVNGTQCMETRTFPQWVVEVFDVESGWLSFRCRIIPEPRIVSFTLTEMENQKRGQDTTIFFQYSLRENLERELDRKTPNVRYPTSTLADPETSTGGAAVIQLSQYKRIPLFPKLDTFPSS
ncbi:hypothetical protein L218DRAFT_991160 [Marasmius fiardii PR-910]|nr:hypothetical protein L218DRAFT_991160 [Marasmius fiardii PR-910]